jgi:predicted transcriptional regulator
MGKENITFRIDSEKRAALDAIAAGLDRDRSYLINEAITLYLDMHQWQIQDIQQGIAEADAGDFAPDEDVQAVFARLTQPKTRSGQKKPRSESAPQS